MSTCVTCRSRPGVIYIGGWMDGKERYECYACDADRRWNDAMHAQEQRELAREREGRR